MRLRILGVACVVATTATVAAQAATPERGRHEGRTDQNQFLKFKVAADRRHVAEFAVGAVSMNCSDGSQFGEPVPSTGRKRRFKIDSKGRFTIERRDYRVRGRVSGRRATGTVRMASRLPSSDGGTVACDSGTVKWSTRLRR